MSGNVERRALIALYRNHPATAPGDRYNWKAHSEARRLRDMLLGWAATQADESLLHCRNLGPVALRWIREQTGDPASPFADLEAENARLREAAEAVLHSALLVELTPDTEVWSVHSSALAALRAALAATATDRLDVERLARAFDKVWREDGWEPTGVSREPREEAERIAAEYARLATPATPEAEDA